MRIKSSEMRGVLHFWS